MKPVPPTHQSPQKPSTSATVASGGKGPSPATSPPEGSEPIPPAITGDALVVTDALPAGVYRLTAIGTAGSAEALADPAIARFAAKIFSPSFNLPSFLSHMKALGEMFGEGDEAPPTK